MDSAQKLLLSKEVKCKLAEGRTNQVKRTCGVICYTQRPSLSLSISRRPSLRDSFRTVSIEVAKNAFDRKAEQVNQPTGILWSLNWHNWIPSCNLWPFAGILQASSPSSSLSFLLLLLSSPPFSLALENGISASYFTIASLSPSHKVTFTMNSTSFPFHSRVCITRAKWDSHNSQQRGKRVKEKHQKHQYSLSLSLFSSH